MSFCNILNNLVKQASIFYKKQMLIFAPHIALGSLIPGRTILCNPNKSNSPNPCPFYNLIISETNQRAYIAGIVDGEGCITIIKRNVKRKNGVFCFYQCLVIVTNANKKMLDFITKLYGGWISTNHKLKGNQKISYNWVCAGDNMRKLLNDILPYLIIKKEQAKLILQFPIYEHTSQTGIKNKGRSAIEKTKQDNLWIKMKKLNRPGKHVTKNLMSQKRYYVNQNDKT